MASECDCRARVTDSNQHNNNTWRHTHTWKTPERATPAARTSHNATQHTTHLPGFTHQKTHFVITIQLVHFSFRATNYFINKIWIQQLHLMWLPASTTSKWSRLLLNHQKPPPKSQLENPANDSRMTHNHAGFSRSNVGSSARGLETMLRYFQRLWVHARTADRRTSSQESYFDWSTVCVRASSAAFDLELRLKRNLAMSSRRWREWDANRCRRNEIAPKNARRFNFSNLECQKQSQIAAF